MFASIAARYLWRGLCTNTRRTYDTAHVTSCALEGIPAGASRRRPMACASGSPAWEHRPHQSCHHQRQALLHRPPLLLRQPRYTQPIGLRGPPPTAYSTEDQDLSRRSGAREWLAITRDLFLRQVSRLDPSTMTHEGASLWAAFSIAFGTLQPPPGPSPPIVLPPTVPIGPSSSSSTPGPSGRSVGLVGRTGRGAGEPVPASSLRAAVGRPPKAASGPPFLPHYKEEI